MHTSQRGAAARLQAVRFTPWRPCRQSAVSDVHCAEDMLRTVSAGQMHVPPVHAPMLPLRGRISTWSRRATMAGGKCGWSRHVKACWQEKKWNSGLAGCLPAMTGYDMQPYCAPHHMPSFRSTGCDRQEDSCTGESACPRMAEALRKQTAPDCSHPECPYGLRRRAAGRQAMQQQPQPACVAPAGLPAAPAATPLLHHCGSIQTCSHISPPLSLPQHSTATLRPEGDS